LKQFPGNYFGGAVGAVVLEPFLLFLPPLWALLVLVAFLPVVVFGASLPFVAVVVPPAVVCANAKLPVNNIANTNVASFFIPFSPFKGSVAELLNLSIWEGFLAIMDFAYARY
jgi:hypothetical protein